MRARLARRIARRYGVEVMVSTNPMPRAMVVPINPPLAVAVLRPTDTIATFRASVCGACAMLRAHVMESLPGDMEVTEARAIVDALPWGPR